MRNSLFCYIMSCEGENGPRGGLLFIASAIKNVWSLEETPAGVVVFPGRIFL